MFYAIYRLSDGYIDTVGQTQSLANLVYDPSTYNAIGMMGLLASSNAHRVVDGHAVPYTEDQLAALAADPGPGHVWNASTCEWSDGRDLAAAQAQAYSRIGAARSSAELSPFTYNGILYDADVDAQRRITGAVTLAMLAQVGAQTFSMEWNAHDGSTVTLDGPSMMGLGVALGIAVAAVFERHRVAKAAVAAATTAAQCDAITL